MNKVYFIIAGGVSFGKINQAEFKSVAEKFNTIAINYTAEYLPWVDEVFTLDTANIKKRYDKLNKSIKRVACIPDDNKNPLPDNFKIIRRLKRDSRDKNGIMTGNSAVGAYEYAIKEGATHIFIFGVDMNEETNGQHWYGGEVVGLHYQALKYWNDCNKIENTYMVNPDSAVNHFKKITWQEAKALCDKL